MRQNDVKPPENNSIKQLPGADRPLCSAAIGTPTVGATFFSRVLNWDRLEECIVIGTILTGVFLHAILGDRWPMVVIVASVVYGGMYIGIRVERRRNKKHWGSP